MLAIILSWTVLFIVFLSYGEIAVCAWNKISKRKDSYSIIDKFWIGICFVGILALYLSIFVALNIWILIATIGISAIIIVNRKSAFKTHLAQIIDSIGKLVLWEKILLGLSFVTILIYSLSAPVLYDEGLYHLQTMQWAEKYETIVGLGNLHGRLGFNSSFLLLSTLFDYHPDYYKTVFSINSLSLLVFSTWIILKMKLADRDQYGKIVALSIVLLVSLFSLGANISSTSTDILPNIFILYLLLKWVLDEDFLVSQPLTLGVLSTFCITLKLSSVAILVALLIGLILLYKNKEKRTATLLISMGLLVATPWLIRFVMLTGYLVYPLPAIDIFSFDWKMPMWMATEEKDMAYTWARIPNADTKQVLAMSFMEWFPVWVKNLSLYNLVFYILAIISPLTILLTLKRAKTKLKSLAWLVGFIGVVVGLMTAPDFRFGFGFILCAGIIPLLLFLQQGMQASLWVRIKQSLAIRYATLSAISVAIVLVSLIAGRQVASNQIYGDRSVLSLACYPQDIDLMQRKAKQTFIEYKLNNTTIFVPQETNQCFDHNIPCLPYYFNNIEMRGNGIEDGFRIKK